MDKKFESGLADLPPDRPAALKQLMDFGLSKGFDLVSFLEPVRRSDSISRRPKPNIDFGPAMSLVTNDRVQSLPLTYPVESWPIAAQSAESAVPFIWRPYEPRYFSMNRLGNLRQIAVRAFFRRFHVSGAITTPVHPDQHTFGFVTWFCCSTQRPPLDEWQDMLDTLQQAAIKFLANLRELPPAPVSKPAHGLSDREVECLRWTALGKSSEEIGELIGRSTETVRFHLKNAIRKLNANNRIHAVAIASYLQLLGDPVEITLSD
jgi:DNA-binding CsgD family transcriptional regulator